VDLRYAACRGTWSRQTIALQNVWTNHGPSPDRRIDIPSPDGKKAIRVRGVHVRLLEDGKRYWAPFGNMPQAELGWASDSRRLFVTWTEGGGALGPWHTEVYEVTSHGLVEIRGVTHRVRDDLIERMKKAKAPAWVTPQQLQNWNSRSYCADDVVGSQWLNGSNEILVAGLAGPDTDRAQFFGSLKSCSALAAPWEKCF
jgi:hypothetical protein